MFHRITLFEVADNKRGMTKIKGAVYVEGDLAAAAERTNEAVGKMANADKIARVVIDRDETPPEGSDPFGSVGTSDEATDGESAAASDAKKDDK